jgi:hypothetical protein
LHQADENLPEVGEFVSEEGKNRMGFTTLGKSKIKACLNLKNLVERGKMIVNSTVLLKEMKNYIRKSGSYEANYGSTDDGISGCLIIVRILEEISSHEQDAYDKLYSIDDGEFFESEEGNEYDSGDTGLPMYIDSGGASLGIQQRGTMSDPYDPNSFDPWGGRFG